MPASRHARSNRNRKPSDRSRSSRSRKKPQTKGPRSRAAIKKLALAASETKVRPTVWTAQGLTVANGLQLTTNAYADSQVLRGLSEYNGTPPVVSWNNSPINMFFPLTFAPYNSWNPYDKDGAFRIASTTNGAQPFDPKVVTNPVPQGVTRGLRVGDRISQININYQSSWELEHVNVPSGEAKNFPQLVELRVIKGYYKGNQLEAIQQVYETFDQFYCAVPWAFYDVVEDYTIKRKADYSGLLDAPAGVAEPNYDEIKIDFNCKIPKLHFHTIAGAAADGSLDVTNCLAGRTPFLVIINPHFVHMRLKSKIQRHTLSFKDL